MPSLFVLVLMAVLVNEPMDLRGLAVWERAEAVISRIKDLGAGERFSYFTEIDPHALIQYIRLERPTGLAFDVQRISNEQWRVTVSRVEASGPHRLSAAFAQCPAFSSLGAAARTQLADAAVEESYRKGQVVCGEDVERDWLGVVTDGTLGVFAGAGEREQLLSQRSAWDLFGEVELLDGGFTIGKTVVLSRSASIAKLPYATVRAVFASEPQFVERLAKSAAQYARALAATLSDHVQHPIVARIAIALMPYAVPGRGLQPALPPLNTITQTQLAAAAGTVKEVAARAIAELERAGAIRRERGRIAFLDRVKLLETIESR